MSSQANSDDSRILPVLNQLGRELTTDDAPDRVLARILSAATILLPVSVCLLWRRDASRRPETLRLEAVQGASPGPPFPRAIPLAGSISQQVLDSRHWQAVPDLKPSGVSEAGLARPRNLAALLCVPVMIDAALAVGIFQGYTVVPHVFNRLQVQTAEALALLIGNLWQRAGLREEVQRLKGELKTRKRVDRAKEILVNRRGISAEEAYRWIQKRSMDTRRSMRDVAETIIQAELSGHYSSIPHALDFGRKSPRE
jgi:GAF domain-containing protein